MQAFGVLLGHIAHDVDEAVTYQVAALVGQLPHHLLLGLHRREVDHRQIAAPLETSILVQHIGDAAGHARREVAPCGPDHDDDATRHVFAAVIARTLHHGHGARVAHGEALTGDAAEIAFPADGAIKH